MYNHIAKRRFGQNFLTNDFVINQIIQTINPQPNDFMIEIGPGLAALTDHLLKILPQLHVVEIDRDIIAYLKKTYSPTSLIIHESDALSFDYSFHQQPLRVVGNLPYNISTPLLFHLSQFENIINMYFMLQKEVVERICATPNCHAYGRLSVMLQYKFNCTKLLDISRENFTPIPKVESAIIRLIPKIKETWHHINHQALSYIVSSAFNQRRKTISNSLRNIINQDTLKALGIDVQKRAENLTVAEYTLLAIHYAKCQNFKDKS